MNSYNEMLVGTPLSVSSLYENKKVCEKNEIKVSAQVIKFAFLIHPLTANDFGRRGAGMIAGMIKIIFGKWLGRWIVRKIGINEEWGMKYLPNGLIEKCLPYLPGRFGYTQCSAFDVKGKAKGYIVATLLTSIQFKKLPRAKVQKRILKNILYCQKRLGAIRIGLGAYNAPALLLKTGKSIFVAPDDELQAELDPKVFKLLKKVQCGITDGDAVSSVSAVHGILQGLEIRNTRAVEKLEFEDSCVAVVGATGIVGGGLARILAIAKKPPQKLILTAHTREEKLNNLKTELISSGYQGEIVTSLKVEAVKGADVVVTCTTGIGDIIKPKHIERDQTVVIVDMARPINVLPALLEHRPNVIHIDGGIVNIGDIDTRFDMGAGKKRNETFACLTQTIIEALSGVNSHHSVGEVEPEYAVQLWQKANEYGFKSATPKSFKRELKIS